MKIPRSVYFSSIEYKIISVSLVIGALSALVFFVSSLFAIFIDEKTIPAYEADIVPPVIYGAHDINIYVGEAPAYRKGVTVEDNSGEASLDVDSSSVRLNEPGKYPVIYTATDKAGNSSSVTVYITVETYFPKENELEEKLDSVISVIIRSGMNTEEKIRAVYDYVYNHIAFVNDSDKSSWKAEAYNALFVTNTGDCFSFFAASKAFFERLGIENLDIKRPDDISAAMQQTHYWSMVNISDEPGNKVWYHYDSCHLRSEYNHSGCLLTEVQINAYNYVRTDFYAYDRSAYPEVSIKIITPTPELEEFYGKE